MYRVEALTHDQWIWVVTGTFAQCAESGTGLTNNGYTVRIIPHGNRKASS